MAQQKVVIPTNLGNEFDLGNIEAGKIHIKVDGITLVRAADGTFSVDAAALAQTIVSADAGQVLAAGADGGAFLTTEVIQDAVGALVADAAGGLTYDDALNALTASVSSAVGADTSSVDITVTNAGGALNISATVIVDAVAGNLLKSNASGLSVNIADIEAALPDTTNAHALTSATDFKTTVDGVTAATSVTEVQDAFGIHLGEMFT